MQERIGSQGVDDGQDGGPIFVHSSFRTSSTWIWLKFRASPETVAYSEIFHEVLATPSTAKLRDLNYASWDSHHPASAPYNLEYFSLLDGDGRVIGYHPDMAYRLFLPEAPDRSITEAEADYVGRLIDHAHGLDRRPVLTCVRTLGRVHGLRRRFGGFHILWYRNLFRQWCSYSEQALNGNPYFFIRTNEILAASRHDRFVATLLDLLPLDVGGGAPHSIANFQRFVLFHLYLYALALPDCSLVADVDELAVDPLERSAFVTSVAKATGIALDLDGIVARIGFQSVPLAMRRELIEGIRIIAGTLPLYVAGWDNRQGVFVNRLIDELAAEMDRCAFYTAGLERFAALGHGRLDLAVAELDKVAALAAAEARIAALEKERDTLFEAGRLHALSQIAKPESA